MVILQIREPFLFLSQGLDDKIDFFSIIFTQSWNCLFPCLLLWTQQIYIRNIKIVVDDRSRNKERNLTDEKKLLLIILLTISLSLSSFHFIGIKRYCDSMNISHSVKTENSVLLIHLCSLNIISCLMFIWKKELGEAKKERRKRQ